MDYYIYLNVTAINGDLLQLIESVLSDRYQRVVWNGQTSKWIKTKAGDKDKDNGLI